MALDEPFQLIWALSWWSGWGLGRLCSGGAVAALAVVVFPVDGRTLGHLDRLRHLGLEFPRRHN